ncbi:MULTISPECIES: chromate efflux transporter [unclassified Janthinobacterium]|uniref:chromate efflux transporter n=1 Tax=unclassified Janthinobacterium TaxID=2610881 RepID=UPI0003472308|nr:MULTISPECIES: chromate efflux transporter [unclassified Janthinobacterium]MEC5162215.1 chromate transporter [Janthinobacterium sp. CG_S6]
MATPVDRPAAVSLSTAFWYWLKLGFISFGGPAGQIALMHTELVERRRWISEQRFLHALNYCMLLPGPEATQLAIYIGWLMHKTRGGVMAGALFVLPSLLILILLSWIYLAFGNVPAVAGVLYGIKPAVVAIVLAAAWRIASRSVKNATLAAIAIAAFLSIAVLRLPFPVIVLGAAAIGLAGGRFWPGQFQIGGGHAHARASYGPAIIDDDSPTPAHARFAWRRLLAVALAGAGLGAGAWLLLAAVFGAASPLAQMGWFFTKAAMMTFGGAYAVLPYVYQGGVDTFHWLSGAQMIDGLALGETTPGPLIMIVAFVGYVGAWTHALFGDKLALAGAAGACVATFFTLLPSFIFILAGGPLVESTRDNIRLTAPLTAISAAVVGVIVSLALFFGQHVFWLETPGPHWDPAAIAISAAACVALFRFRVGTIKLIFACAFAGLVLSYLS